MPIMMQFIKPPSIVKENSSGDLLPRYLIYSDDDSTFILFRELDEQEIQDYLEEEIWRTNDTCYLFIYYFPSYQLVYRSVESIWKMYGE